MTPVNYYHRDHWEHVHDGTSAAGAAVRAVAESAARVLDLAAGAVVVDVACGTGPFLSMLPTTITRVGVDLAFAALRAGTGVCGDAMALPLRDNSVDVVTMLSAWWALPDAGRGVAEAARVLRPGGTLLVHTWDQASRCRLITLGASCVARVLPSMIRPEGVRSPFGADVGPVLRQAVLEPVRTEQFSYTWPGGSVGEYWAEFAQLAPTSYAAYRAADDAQRATIDRLLSGVLGAGAGLSWRLTAAQPTGSGTGTANRTAASACSRVVGNTGTGATESPSSSSISVHP